MILSTTPQIIDGQTYYKMAMVTKSVTDEEGNTTTEEDWYTIPSTRTILLGRDGAHDIIRHTPDTPGLSDRLRASTEYLADNNPGLMARHLRIARLCVTVFHGEPDGEGCRQSELLGDYVTRGGDPLEIVSTETAGDYFIAE